MRKYWSASLKMPLQAVQKYGNASPEPIFHSVIGSADTPITIGVPRTKSIVSESLACMKELLEAGKKESPFPLSRRGCAAPKEKKRFFGGTSSLQTSLLYTQSYDAIALCMNHFCLS